MSECHAVMNLVPDLLVESLDGEARERAFRHLESCEDCGREWSSYRETWSRMGALPDLPVPQRVRGNFENYLEAMKQSGESWALVLPFRSREWLRWAAQAAGVVLLVGAAFFAGSRQTSGPLAYQQPATLTSIAPISDRMIVPAAQLRPGIEGTPDIRNVQVFNEGAEIGVTFDITQSLTVRGQPEDRSLVELISYVLQNEKSPSNSRSEMIEWVKNTYSDDRPAEPGLVLALANVLANDAHEGVRIKAVDALGSLSPGAAESARESLIHALKNDPNPAVRMKAVDALANMIVGGTQVDPATVDTLRQKATQDDENVYVRVKAAEALSRISL
jgi:hypothetical protein